MMRYIGVDPGLSGAVACIYEDGHHSLHDMPILTFKKGKGMRREYDAQALHLLLGALINHNRMQCHVMIEQQGAIPKQGIASTFRTGFGFGVIVGIVNSLSAPHTIVNPKTWKKAMGVTADKQGVILRTKQLFPDAELPLKKHHGRAEALLLAEHARRTQGG